jgi:DNA-binding NarL/FixJ family response regulator
MDGLRAAAQLAKQSNASVLMLSMVSDERRVLQAIQSGAKGYLLKDSSPRTLANAIRAVYNGQTFFSPEIANLVRENDK